jgi:tetratricopeptide (TPR) repeat protein
MLIKNRAQRIPSVRLVGAALEAIISGAQLPALDRDITPTPPGGVNELATDVFTETPDGPTLPGTPPPGFNQTDSQSLVDRLDSIQRQQQQSERRLRIIAGMTAIILIAVVLAFLAFRASQKDNEGEDATATQVSGSGFNPENIPLVEPVADNEVMILLTELEQIGETERDVTRFIQEDLFLKFERDLTISNVRIRFFPQVVTTPMQANLVAEANNADVILWGRYDDQQSEVNLQVNNLDEYPHNLFSLEQLNEIAATRFVLTNERQQTLAIPVLAGLLALNTGEADVFENSRYIAILTELGDVVNPEIPGNSLAADFHEYYFVYRDSPEQALEIANRGLERSARNPIFYAGRAVAYQRLGQLANARDDIGTAETLGPEGWMMPTILLANQILFFESNPASALPLYDQVIAARPDDWFIYDSKGIIEYLLSDFDSATQSLSTAIQLGPEANFPYPFATGLALRRGELLRAQQLVAETLEKFPDPTSGKRFVEAIYDVDTSLLTTFMEVYGNLTLRQWNNLLSVVDSATILPMPSFADIYLYQGVAHCNLQDYAAAEASFTRVIELDPDYTFAYLLRAEVREKQGDRRGFLSDIAEVGRSGQARQYAPYMAAFRIADINCSNFLTVDLAALAEEGVDTSGG